MAFIGHKVDIYQREKKAFPLKIKALIAPFSKCSLRQSKHSY